MKNILKINIIKENKNKDNIKFQKNNEQIILFHQLNINGLIIKLN